LANETKNAAEVIGKDGGSKPSTIDEPRRLEDVLVLFSDLLQAIWVVQ